MPPFVPILAAVEEAARREGFAVDAAQLAVARRMALAATRALEGRPTKGVYLHGPAGRGKSWLADAVYAAVPPGRAARVHFSGFFDDLHRRIHAHRPEPDAMARAIDDVVGSDRLVFFDELHVHDPGDAILLTRLVERLVDRGGTLVATSNYAPSELLPDPVWHHLFEPGIALLTTHLDVIPLEGPIDFRTLAPAMRQGFRAGTWSTGASPVMSGSSQQLVVRDRVFTVASAGEGALVATFDQLCETPLAASEYRHWSRRYPHWTIIGVPPLDEVGPAAQQRFVALIDVLVDADVRLDVQAVVPVDEFVRRCAGRPDAFRMASRLRLLRSL